MRDEAEALASQAADQTLLAEAAQAEADHYADLAANPPITQQTTLFAYDQQGHLLGEYDGAGNVRREYVWLGDLPLATITLAGVNYIQADHLNTPVSMVDDAQVTVWDATREPFGETVTEGIAELPLRFPGQYQDIETGLHYNYFRDYDPGTGRYVESDPIGLEGGLNLFTYAEGTPQFFVDPTGLTAGLMIKKGERRPNPQVLDKTFCLTQCLDTVLTITEGDRTQKEHDELRRRNPGIKNPTTDHTGGKAVDVRRIPRSPSDILCCAAKCGFSRAKRYADDGHWHFDERKANGWGERIPKYNACTDKLNNSRGSRDSGVLMNNWTRVISGLLIFSVCLGCSASAPTESEVSSAYYEAARKLYAYEQTLGKEVRAIVTSSCSGCDIEEDVDVMIYDDVLRLLQYAIENDRANHKANLLMARIRLSRSILGFGDFDPKELHLAKTAIDRVPMPHKDRDIEKERQQLSASIAEALHQGN